MQQLWDTYCVEICCVELDVFIAVVLSATRLGSLRPSSKDSPENVSRIHDVGFFCLNSNTWDNTSAGSEALLAEQEEYNPRDTYTYNNQPVLEHPCTPLMKILSSGTFYYAPAPQWDISSRLSRRVVKGKQMGGEVIAYDERFLWNEYIVRSLLDFRGKLDAKERREIDMCQFIVRTVLFIQLTHAWK